MNGWGSELGGWLLQVTLSALHTVIGAAAGFVVSAWWHRKQLEELTGAQVAARSSLNRLQQLTSHVDDRVVQHSKQVEQINERLSNACDASTAVPVVAAAQDLLGANQRLQADLVHTRRELGEQPQQLESHPQESRTDALTLLFNRRAFDERLQAFVAQIRPGASAGTLLLLDIDHFTRTNDRHGQQVGDQMLSQVARIIRETLLGLDLVAARYGGEKFAVILPGQSLPTAKKLAEEIRTAVEQAKFKCDNESVSVTFSVGLVQAEAGLKREELVSRAEQALQAAKHAGGNRVFLHNGRTCIPLEPEPVRTVAAARDDAQRPSDRASVAAKSTPERERRQHARIKCDATRWIAPFVDGVLPTPDQFFSVHFNDISPGGFAMTLPTPPSYEDLVVALHKPDGVIYLSARVVRTVKSSAAQDAPYTVGCRFTGRVTLDSQTRAQLEEVQA